MPKNANFEFSINQPNRPMIMIYKLGKVSLGILTRNPSIWACGTHIRRNIQFFDVKCHFWPFSHKWKIWFLVEYSTGIEISTKIFYQKKLVTFADIPYCGVEKKLFKSKMLYFQKLLSNCHEKNFGKRKHS